MSWRFNSSAVKEEAGKPEAKWFIRLKGFNPKNGDVAEANVADKDYFDHVIPHRDFIHTFNIIYKSSTLTVTANTNDKMYKETVANIDVGSEAVNCNTKKDEIIVIIKKPNAAYSLSSKMQK